MSNMTLQESLLLEIQNLPEDRQADVLAFVRFLKIGLADDQNLELQFTEALDKAGAISDERGISNKDIEDEIKAARSSK
jgi:hypothetical protein